MSKSKYKPRKNDDEFEIGWDINNFKEIDEYNNKRKRSGYW